MPYRRLRSKPVYENKFLVVYDDDVEFPDGKVGTYVRISYHGNPEGVIVVPRTEDGRYLMLKIDRYASGEASWEFPRGTGEQGISPIDQARAELREETGFEASNIRVLGKLRPDAAIMETRVTVFLAEIQKDFDPQPNFSEGIRICELVTEELLWSWVREGNVTDGFTLGALALLMGSNNV